MIAGVFGSTFVKMALQLGAAGAYITLDTFPWCPILRCYWGWRDMCHNCELCYNSGGGGEASSESGGGGCGIGGSPVRAGAWLLGCVLVGVVSVRRRRHIW